MPITKAAGPSPAESTTISIRVPRDVSDAYATAATLTGVSKSRLAADALGAYLGMLRAGWTVAEDPRLRTFVANAAAKGDPAS